MKTIAMLRLCQRGPLRRGVAAAAPDGDFALSRPKRPLEFAGPSDQTTGPPSDSAAACMNRPFSVRPPSPSTSAGGQLSELTRAAVSVAIALSLVGLVLSMVADTGSGSSALVRTIKGRLFAAWMVPAWLDLGFDYRLTYGTDEDADHGLRVGRYAAGETAAVAFPGTLTGERAARWRRLARTVVTDRDDADRDGLLAAAIGQGMFAALGGQDLVVRVMRTPLRERGGPAPAASEAVSARVRLVDGDLQLLRSEPRGEVAPLLRRAADGRDGAATGGDQDRESAR